ncbi:hypothetical protein GCK72_025972 [Caenorhabditis remanei]|uniref:Uncharacterized protein n=1 Tax=Caenorhabditis remanei TaxID=31234 RepID=A0A6A5G4J6_CAERE|nr:hypothetical protein GCK72_025972 [Caenorhabditis remanei]KAF1749504.1 hypothetical protein GCK72_025972 [Caenorhabditis remanei]
MSIQVFFASVNITDEFVDYARKVNLSLLGICTVALLIVFPFYLHVFKMNRERDKHGYLPSIKNDVSAPTKPPTAAQKSCDRKVVMNVIAVCGKTCETDSNLHFGFFCCSSRVH